MSRQIAIRLGTTGRAQVIADLDQIGKTGDATFTRVAKAAERAGLDAEAAIARSNRQAEKLAALMPGLNPTKLNMAAGIQDGTRKSAESSAAVFSAAFAEMEKRAEGVRLALDPMYAAQQRANREVAEAKILFDAGALSGEHYAQVQARAAAATQRGAVSVGQFRAGSQQLSYQIGDVSASLASGTSVVQVFGQQIGQTVQAIQLMQGEAKGFIGFMGGPWGAVLTGGITLAAMLGSKLLFSADAADTKKDAATELADAIDDLDKATRRQTQTETQAQDATLASAAALRDKAQSARDATIQVLKLARADLAAAMGRSIDPTLAGEGGFNPGAAAASRFATQAKQLDQLLKQQEARLDKTQVSFRRAREVILQREATASIDGTAAATQRYEVALGRLNVAHEKGRVTDAAYRSEVTRLMGVRDSETEAASKSTGASNRRGASAREAARAVREHAKAERELGTDLADLVRRFNPVQAAADSYAETLAKIATLMGSGKLSLGEANFYGVSAAMEEDGRRREAQLKMLGINDDPLKVASGQEIQEADDADRQAERDRLDRGKQQVQELADFYRGAFDVANGNIWDFFRQRGLDALADLLAKWTAGQGGGGIGGAISKLLGITKAVTGGGAAWAGSGGIGAADGNLGVGSLWVDLPKLAGGTEWWRGGQALVGEHGPEIASLPRGTRVTPAASTRRLMAANDGGSYRPAFHFDLRGAVMTQDLLAQMNALADGAAVRGAVAAVPLAAADARAQSSRRLGRTW